MAEVGQISKQHRQALLTAYVSTYLLVYHAGVGQDKIPCRSVQPGMIQAPPCTELLQNARSSSLTSPDIPANMTHISRKYIYYRQKSHCTEFKIMLI